MPNLPQFPSGDPFQALDRADIQRSLTWSGTATVRSGPNSDGVLFGTVTPQPVLSCFRELHSGPTFTDYTTAANEATANDVDIFTTVDHSSDALYVGSATPFFSVKINVSTAMIKNGGAQTFVWEYSKGGTSWGSIPNVVDSTSTDTHEMLDVTGSHFVSFNPPSDWLANTVNSVSAYYVRLRVTVIDGGVITCPLIQQIWTYNAGVGLGTGIPFGLTSPYGNSRLPLEIIQASVTVQAPATGGTVDNKFMLVNWTTGQSYTLTLTKSVGFVVDTNIRMVYSPADQFGLIYTQSDTATSASSLNFVFNSLIA